MQDSDGQVAWFSPTKQVLHTQRTPRPRAVPTPSQPTRAQCPPPASLPARGAHPQPAYPRRSSANARHAAWSSPPTPLMTWQP